VSSTARLFFDWCSSVRVMTVDGGTRRVAGTSGSHVHDDWWWNNGKTMRVCARCLNIRRHHEVCWICDLARNKIAFCCNAHSVLGHPSCWSDCAFEVASCTSCAGELLVTLCLCLCAVGAGDRCPSSRLWYDAIGGWERILIAVLAVDCVMSVK